MEFDKSRILTVVTADQAKVGSMGHFSNYIPTLEGYVTRGCKPDKLVRVSLNTIYPFSDGHNYYSLFYPAPEPTYAERQAQWVKENNVVVGTKVCITKRFSSYEKGFDCAWNKSMDKTIGTKGSVTRIYENSLEVSTVDDFWYYPYFVLEVIKEPTYRPFKTAEEFKPFRDEWFRVKNGGGFERVGFYNNTGVKDSTGNFITYQKLFEAGERENGEPCGVREET